MSTIARSTIARTASARSAGVAIGLLVLVTACSGGDPETSPEPSARTSASAVRVTPPVEKIVNEPAARKDVTQQGCAAAEGGWGASGSVRNSTKKEADYTIVVSFTNSKSTVLARGTKKVTVAPGKSAKWATSAKFKAPKDVVCVLRGVDRT
ncbi:MAG: hypothetical protein ACRCXL_07615 [Dermatophilaceae bacterium]